VRLDWQEALVRIFRPGTYSFLADNTDKAGMFSGQTVPGVEVGFDEHIYHYSRIGNPAIISKRIRNLDTFFHPEDDLVPVEELPAYDFDTRAYDNYSTTEAPPKVDAEFSKFEGTHPEGVLEWFAAMQG
jgi:hypothetical protein